MSVKATVDVLTALSKLGYSVGVNDLTDGLTLNGSALTDNLRAKLEADLQDEGITNFVAAWRVITREAMRSTFNPLSKYLSGVSYDGGQHIDQLVGCFDTSDPMFGVYLRRWLIGAVRRAVEGGHQNFMLVLDGKQGIGKSDFARWLVPVDLQRAHFKGGSISPENKDHRLALWHTWIWEVSEIGSTTRRADVDALKDFLSSELVRERQPYGRYPLTKPARTSFLATVNADGAGFLNDPTGSRRFVIVPLGDIDWSYVDIGIDNVWGEAYAAYLSGETGKLSYDESLSCAVSNEAYEIEKPVEILLDKYFEVDATRIADPTYWTFTHTILAKLSGEMRTSETQIARDIATTLTKAGCVRDRRYVGARQIRGYWGVKERLIPL